jgi:predicted transcriptional regulator of viral defense system
MRNEKITALSKFIEQLQSQGRCTFIKSEAMNVLGISKNAFKVAAWRLTKKKRLAHPKHNFYVIVPFEYKTLGCPPAAWFIDDLMKHLQLPYYVGLLTAAAMYGAAHQQPQVFQVVTSRSVSPVKVGRITINFVCNKLIAKTPIEKRNTPTGYMNVASPEATAFDLVKYLPLVGHINNAATILIELQEKLREDKLIEIAQNIASVRGIQRLGYILDYIKSRINTDRLAQIAKTKGAQYIPLIAGKGLLGVGVEEGEGEGELAKASSAGSALGITQRMIGDHKDRRWKIFVNETIEPDLDL